MIYLLEIPHQSPAKLTTFNEARDIREALEYCGLENLEGESLDRLIYEAEQLWGDDLAGCKCFRCLGDLQEYAQKVKRERGHQAPKIVVLAALATKNEA